MIKKIPRAIKVTLILVLLMAVVAVNVFASSASTTLTMGSYYAQTGTANAPSGSVKTYMRTELSSQCRCKFTLFRKITASTQTQVGDPFYSYPGGYQDTGYINHGYLDYMGEVSPDSYAGNNGSATMSIYGR